MAEPVVPRLCCGNSHGARGYNSEFGHFTHKHHLNPTVQFDVSLVACNTFGVAARAERFVRVTSLDELIALHGSPSWGAGRRLILGAGSNVLLTGDFPGLVIQIALSGREMVRQDEHAWYVRAAAGEQWDALVRWTLSEGWHGLENLVCIPGTVGAAPIQNIGAYGVELADRFDHLEALDTESGRIVRLDASDCRFAYRDSAFKQIWRERMIITSVTLRLPKKWRSVLDYGDVRGYLAAHHRDSPGPVDVADAVAAIRTAKLPDPSILGNAGSFFRNPVISAEDHAILRRRYPLMVSYLQQDGRFKIAAAWLIEQCGWKGRSIGRAGVYEHQPLVLVNRGGATGSDVLELAQAIAQSIRVRFGIELETEPVIV